LYHQIEGGNEEGVSGDDAAYPFALEAAGDDVRHRIAAQGAEFFGEEEHEEGPAQEGADGIDDGVIALDEDHAGGAEEGGGGQIIPG